MTQDFEDDPVVSEIPVYLAKKLSDHLHIIQYPVRPLQNTIDNDIVKARVRPKCGQMEVQVSLRTKSYNYDRQKGQQIAINVDGPDREMRDSDDNYFQSDVMDNIVLTSSGWGEGARRYAVGVVSDNALHLTPLTSFMVMKPKCSHLDMADKRAHKEKDHESSPESDDINDLRKVSVRFEKNETEQRKNARERSYEFLQRKIREEPWIDIKVNKLGSERSLYNIRGLNCAYENEKVDNFHLINSEYLNQLVPCRDEPDIAPKDAHKEILPSQLLQIPMQQHLHQVMIKANLATFSEIECALNRGEELGSSIVKDLQKDAVLVQGCWVLKSEFLYPAETEKLTKKKQSISGISHEILKRGRDYALYLFTKNRILKKSDVEDKIDIPGSELINILKKFAVPTTNREEWEFMLPTDISFINRNKVVAQRQQMLWQSRHEQLSNTFKPKEANTAVD